MYDQGELARGATLVVCGREYAFDRSLDMLRRAEGAIGAVAPFAQRLDARAARSDEIARVYNAFLRDVPGAPMQEEVAAWVFERGLLHRELAIFLYSLTMGSDELERVSKARGLNAETKAGKEPLRGPFARTDEPIGPSFSRSAAGWDGHPPRSGQPRYSR